MPPSWVKVQQKATVIKIGRYFHMIYMKVTHFWLVAMIRDAQPNCCLQKSQYSVFFVLLHLFTIFFLRVQQPFINKTGTSKVGAISKAQKAKVFKIVKRGTLWAFWKSSLLQNILKMKGDPLEILKNFRKKRTMRTLKQSHSAEKPERGERPFGIFETSVCWKISKHLKGDPLGRKKSKKSVTVPKKKSKGTILSRPVLYLTLKRE